MALLSGTTTRSGPKARGAAPDAGHRGHSPGDQAERDLARRHADAVQRALDLVDAFCDQRSGDRVELLSAERVLKRRPGLGEVAGPVEGHARALGERDLVLLRVLQQPQAGLGGVVGVGDAVRDRESGDDLVADDLVELVAADLVRAAVAELEDRPVRRGRR